MFEKMEENQGPKISLVGIGMGTSKSLTLQAHEAIARADAVIGAARMLHIVCEDQKEMDEQSAHGRDAGRPVCYEEYRAEEILRMIRSHPEHRTWAILLSGDLGFYSGAKALTDCLKREGLMATHIPGIASVVYLAAALGISWEDAALRSIHGRSSNFIYVIDRHEKTFLLLGRDSAKLLCEKLHAYGMDDVICYVGNRLSYPDQEILTRRGDELCPEDMKELSAVLIVNPNPNRMCGCHLPDEAFERMSGAGGVPMTKEEVRALSIAKLALTEDAVVYDIGAGTGSVSVESALQGEQIRVFAVERREDACELIRANRKKFRADQIEVICGTAPEALAELPAPTHVFIGGSSGNLKAILRAVKEKNPHVRIVLNAIALETVAEAVACMKEGLLCDPQIVQVSVAKARALGQYHMMTGQNPIYIITEGENRWNRQDS